MTWQDVNLDKQYLTVRRSMRYNGARHKTEIGATKRKKVRTVDFCDTLAAILKAAKTEQHKNRLQYGGLYHLNYYTEVKEKDRTYYEVYSLPRTDEIPEGYKEISFVCLRPDGAYKSPSTVGIMCRRSRAWRAFISTNFVTHSRAICSQTGQRRRMCRSFSDMPMSVPQ